MTNKRMTIGELERARDRAVGMFSNFGDAESAAEFEGMTPEQYAERKGIEVIERNPLTRNRRERIMAQKSKRVEGLEGVVEDNHTVATREYETKAELQAALDEIAEACVDALPDLGDSESENEDDDSDDDSD